MEHFEMDLPAAARAVMAALRAAGHQAYGVGGCVRDSLLGRVPGDWDLATDAPPQRVRAVLEAAGMRVWDTGAAHGTVTARHGGQAVEVTTFRQDGPYLDGRRPQSVSFGGDIAGDLARRDFTVNAMAWDGQRIIDPFGGRADLQAGLIRAVGRPDDRFAEDGLRILRALRFAARLGFAIEPQTAAALRRCKAMLEKIARERVRDELLGLLAGPRAGPVLREYADILAVILPEITPALGFDQNNHHHIYDVWAHTVAAVEAAPPDPVVRLALLLHDLGKPETYTVDARGVGHFYGHGAASAALAEGILARLRFDGPTRDRVLRLVKRHDSDLCPTRKSVRRWLARLGEAELRMLVAVKRADSLAQNPRYQPARQAELAEVERLLDRLVEAEGRLSVASLAVDGRDMLALGLRGPRVGAMLGRLLEAVLAEECPNRREPLLALARKKLELSGPDLHENT